MPKRGDVFTVPDPDGAGWVNKVGGQEVSRHRLQRTAAEAGRRLARANQAEHVIYNSRGQVSEKNSYGSDPRSRRDKNR